MKIGVVFAMYSEAERLLERYSNFKKIDVHGMTFYEVNSNLVICVGGVGKVNIAAATTVMNERYAPEMIINAGVAGCLKDWSTGTVLVAPHCVQHDYDCRLGGDPLGVVSTVGVREFLTHDPEETKSVLHDNGFSVRDGIVATGDWFSKDFKRAEWVIQEFGAVVCDMEAAAVCQVCLIYNVEAVVIKVVSDHVFSENQDEEFREGVPNVANILTDAVETLINYYIKMAM